uniref:Uncharacterized protein n=1 Tax=Caenorhabditis tropicalis TaxID=1561998 RepID=A0A1I7U3E4_9PELO
MASTSVQNMSTNSWNSLSKDERKKLIVKIHETNNEMKHAIDNRQKSLAEMRQMIPEECREMLEKEKRILLNHYTTAELLPHLPIKGPSKDDVRRMITNINERVEAQVADQEETKVLIEETEKLRQESNYLQNKIRKMAEEMLRECEN